MRPTYEQLTRECDEALASLDATLANMPPLDPDTEAMIVAPAATVAGSITPLDATKPLLKATCDEAGHWRYVPAAEIDGPRVPERASLAIAATNLDATLMDAVASALNIPVDPARAAVEGAAA